jgi:hypothetical protein
VTGLHSTVALLGTMDSCFTAAPATWKSIPPQRAASRTAAARIGVSATPSHNDKAGQDLQSIARMKDLEEDGIIPGQ